MPSNEQVALDRAEERLKDAKAAGKDSGTIRDLEAEVSKTQSAINRAREGQAKSPWPFG